MAWNEHLHHNPCSFSWLLFHWVGFPDLHVLFLSSLGPLYWALFIACHRHCSTPTPLCRSASEPITAQLYRIHWTPNSLTQVNPAKMAARRITTYTRTHKNTHSSIKIKNKQMLKSGKQVFESHKSKWNSLTKQRQGQTGLHYNIYQQPWQTQRGIQLNPPPPTHIPIHHQTCSYEPICLCYRPSFSLLFVPLSHYSIISVSFRFNSATRSQQRLNPT